VVGSLLISLLRHSDRVTSACQAQLVNSIGSIRTEPGGPAWRQSMFHPFAQMAAAAKGTVLQAEIRSPRHETARYGEVPVIDAAATFDEASGDLAVFAVNRHPSEEVTFDVELRAFPGRRLEMASVLHDPDWRASNTREDPDRVTPHPHPKAEVTGDRLHCVLPPVSWNVFRVARS
jgi:alpha-N-arabinofuranosidase